ncbi:predicted protein [Verticillium alfalfae VaMs.102]|uniref:Predicted protein n=1 Tax=Verticillium alfalfae (strain VaMs.102 / ATCC MYA-4576 / FGSC 10136) TaxID=526221 RepID=C9SDI5_VERA1|nr:predicted protein [Verticillium alfalfae VaMs.102]EEY17137.1 predicted protein [Verticillium alfalfae VaMs.102]
MHRRPLTRVARSSSSRAKPLPAAAAPRSAVQPGEERGPCGVTVARLQTGFPPAASGTSPRQAALFVFSWCLFEGRPSRRAARRRRPHPPSCCPVLSPRPGFLGQCGGKSRG